MYFFTRAVVNNNINLGLFFTQTYYCFRRLGIILWTTVIILLWSLWSILHASPFVFHWKKKIKLVWNEGEYTFWGKLSFLSCVWMTACMSPSSCSVQWDFMCFSLYISIMSCMLLTAELMMKLFPVCETERQNRENFVIVSSPQRQRCHF